MKMLSKDNDVKRGEIESKQFAKGGKLYNGGDPSVPASNNLAWNHNLLILLLYQLLLYLNQLILIN